VIYFKNNGAQVNRSSWCRECGAKLESEMSVCPSCGLDFRKFPHLLGLAEDSQAGTSETHRRNVPIRRWLVVATALLAVSSLVLAFRSIAGGPGGHEGRLTSDVGVPEEGIPGVVEATPPEAEPAGQGAAGEGRDLVPTVPVPREPPGWVESRGLAAFIEAFALPEVGATNPDPGTLAWVLARVADQPPGDACAFRRVDETAHSEMDTPFQWVAHCGLVDAEGRHLIDAGDFTVRIGGARSLLFFVSIRSDGPNRIDAFPQNLEPFSRILLCDSEPMVSSWDEVRVVRIPGRRPVIVDMSYSSGSGGERGTLRVISGDESSVPSPEPWQTTDCGGSTPPSEESRHVSENRADAVAGKSDGPTVTPFTVAPEVGNRQAISQALEREYPPLLRDAGVGGTVLMYFFIDEDGAVREFRVHESSGHEALDRAAMRVADVFEFSAAMHQDRRVPVWIQIPIHFSTR